MLKISTATENIERNVLSSAPALSLKARSRVLTWPQPDAQRRCIYLHVHIELEFLILPHIIVAETPRMFDKTSSNAVYFETLIDAFSAAWFHISSKYML